MSTKKHKALIIVESPAKIKTLRKFLGAEYQFESSIGHIRDLPAKEFGIDVEADFEPSYVTMPDKKDVISKLKKAASECEMVYLSPDPDREGEAIAWHISQILPEGTLYKRVSFNSITKEEVVKALQHPREIDNALVDAQQARRLLDRIVGYKISPILNRKLQRGRNQGVSAGRVQSVALKLVVDREKEIEAFKPTEYWTLTTVLKNQEEERNFRAGLWSVEGIKVEKEAVDGKDVYLINNETKAKELQALLRSSGYTVAKVEKKEKRRHPMPPFITSTIQQEASRHLGFSAARTMSVAQSLYEGVDLGADGAEGLITYMRTDSVRIAPEALAQARKLIKGEYGENYLPESPRIYSTKKSAQDAHEAIRPANLLRSPESVRSYLSKEQFDLYSLIWKRFIASQMVSAIYDTVSADIETTVDMLLRATGSILKFPGYLAVYEEKEDDTDEEGNDKILPDLYVGQKLNLLDVLAEQSFTRPPPRFTEASLVKELEKSGIGRPSTYAAIMNKIQSREYTVKENKRLKPTELGRVIAQMLETSFEKIMDINFTANMEDDLELVADNKKNWRKLLKEFWDEFSPTVAMAEKEAFVPKILTDIDCPTCGAKLQKVWYKDKYFFGCSRYPDCSFSAPIEQVEFSKEDYSPDFDWDHPCPVCGSEMKVRHGRYGSFLGCSKYPECRGIVKIPEKGEVYIPPEDMPNCPAIDCPGKLTARKSRFGKTFYSCSTYPDCDVILNDLDQAAEKYPNHPRTPYQKKAKAGKGKAKGKEETTTKKTKATKGTKATKEKKAAAPKKPRTVVAKEFTLSAELTAIVGENKLPRGEVLKKLWSYIKDNNLQDTKDKRMIAPDDKLAKLFGSKDPINMMKIAGMITKHIS